MTGSKSEIKSKSGQVYVIEHPVIQHKLSVLRDKETPPPRFRRLMEEISELMAYEVSRDFRTRLEEVETPLAKTKGPKLLKEEVLVSIMRAGNGMLNGMMKLLSLAPVGHIGIYRDKFMGGTVEYYFRLPADVKGKRILLLDPLLATADTAIAAINRLKQYEVSSIRMVNILSSKPGLEKLHSVHPDVEVFTLSIEPELDAKGYILPGLGDAGDRLYGTMDVVED